MDDFALSSEAASGQMSVAAEYNLALGERRAAAVRTYLANLGIADSRITLVSKGEEDPACQERDEPCWSMNRRGHFVITAK